MLSLEPFDFWSDGTVSVSHVTGVPATTLVPVQDVASSKVCTPADGERYRIALTTYNNIQSLLPLRERVPNSFLTAIPFDIINIVELYLKEPIMVEIMPVLQRGPHIQEYADDEAAAKGGVPLGGEYYTSYGTRRVRVS